MNELYPANKNSKTIKAGLRKKKPAINEKWINYDDGDTRKLKEDYWDDASRDSSRPTITAETLFNELAVIPSADRGLIASENLILSGDGSSLHIHSSPFGHKVKDADTDDQTHRYTAPDADIGWDSNLGVFYLGYTLYNISHHNASLGADLPVFLTLRAASQHDALTTISATAQYLDMNPDLHPKYTCFDSASDSYDIYEYLRHKHIIPAIDWNQRASSPKNPYAEYEHLNEHGVPVCRCGAEMVRDGYDMSKMAAKYRCPYKKGRVESCPYAGECSKSDYGRVVKVCDKTNLKLFSPLMYGSDEWKKVYKNRTCTERINNRILNDYGLHSLTCRNGSKHFFFMIIAGINIHMDAWAKQEHTE